MHRDGLLYLMKTVFVVLRYRQIPAYALSQIPVTTFTWSVTGTGGRYHSMAIYLDCAVR